MRPDIFMYSLMIAVLTPALSFAYGEGEDISENARAIHLLLNEARCDPAATIEACGDACIEGAECYASPRAPLFWRSDLARAAQFHAKVINEMSCLMKASPCKLVSTIAQDYPDKCDGSVKCACDGGTAVCHTSLTTYSDRIKLFTGSEFGTIAENIALSIKPDSVLSMLLYKNGGVAGSCEGDNSNEDRRNILSEAFNAVGIGTEVKFTVQDFSSNAKEISVISAGSHYMTGTLLWFKAHYYSTKPAAKVMLVLGDGSDEERCNELKLSAGTATNGIYSRSDITDLPQCTSYYFEVVDEDGTYTKYPTEGSLLYNCYHSWQNRHFASCLNPDDPGGEDHYVEPKPGNHEDPVDPGTEDPDPIDPGTEDPDPGTTDTPEPTSDSHSGSDGCSATMNHPGQFGWLGLLLAALSFGFIRRRRSNQE